MVQKIHLQLNEIFKILILIGLFISFYIFLTTDLNAKVLGGILSILIISSIYLFVKDFLAEKNLGFWAFWLSFIFYAGFIFFGIDLSDETYSLSLSWFFGKQYPESYLFPFAYRLSQLWLQVIGNPSFLWNRLANALIYALDIFLGYQFLSIVKPEQRRINFWISVASIFILDNISRFLVPIHKISNLLFLALIVVWLKSKADYKYLFLGVFSAFLIFSKFTVIVFLLIFILADYFVNKRFVFLYFLSGIILGFLIVMFLGVNLKYVALSFKNIYSSYCFNQDYTHNFKFLMKRYLFDLKLTGILTAGWLSFIFLGKRFNSKAVPIIAIVIFAGFLLYKYFQGKQSVWFYVIFSLWLAVFVMQKFEKQNLFASISILLLLGFAVAGSDVGFRKIAGSGALSAFVIISAGVSFKNFPKFIKYALIFTAFVGLFTNFMQVYRDYPIWALDTQFNIKSLKGIFTVKQKVLIIEDFDKKLSKISDLDSNLLVVNKAYIFALTQNAAPKAICWFTNPNLFTEQNLKLLPKYIIISTRSLGRKDWFLTEKLTSKLYYQSVKKKYEFIKQNYKLVFASKDSIFLLYKKPIDF